MRRVARVLLLAAALACTARAAMAAGVFPVGMSESRRVALRGAAANVIVGDPAIADVAMVDSHSVIILGKGYGATDVMVLDHAGHVLFDQHVMVSPPDNGRVTVHRGTDATDVYCIVSRCAPVASTAVPVNAFPNAPPPSGSAATAGPTAAPLTAPGV